MNSIDSQNKQTSQNARTLSLIAKKSCYVIEIQMKVFSSSIVSKTHK